MIASSLRVLNNSPRPRNHQRFALVLATALAGSLAATYPAHAQDASQLAAIQAQIASLQAQLRKLQRETAARDAQLQAARADAADARAEAAQAQAQVMRRPLNYAATPPGGELGGLKPAAAGAPFVLGGYTPPAVSNPAWEAIKPTLQVGGFKVTLGGFIDNTFMYRSRDLTSGTSTSYNSIPYNNSVNGHLGEFRDTAQPTRFSALIQAQTSPTGLLGAYIEGDFNGAATTANSVQSSSYTPRMRVAYAQYDDSAMGLHALFGQEWSLAVGSTVGITARKEFIVPVIDSNYVPGFVQTRTPQVRVVQQLGKMVWLGASLEAPQETYSIAGLSSTGSLPTLPAGSVITYQNTGGSFLNSTANYSYDTAPDMIVKAAFDPGFGHYEVYGLGRFFRTRTSTAATLAVPASGDTHTVFGGGVGGSMVIPVVPKMIDLVGNVLVGSGVGRYGSGQLPDATFDAEGAPKTLRQVIGMAGVIGHPTPAIDLYGLVGTEQDHASSFSVTAAGKTTGFGYGTPFASDAGCATELGSCSAQTRAISDVSVGAWWRFLQGSYGTVEAGAEYSYVKKIAFSGVGGKPSTDDSIAFFTLRYLPFGK